MMFFLGLVSFIVLFVYFGPLVVLGFIGVILWIAAIAHAFKMKKRHGKSFLLSIFDIFD